MKIGKIGYITSGVIHIIISIISYVFKLRTQNTWWTFCCIIAFITPSLIQTIINIKRNRGKRGVAILYLILVFMIYFYILLGVIIFIAIKENEKLPLY